MFRYNLNKIIAINTPHKQRRVRKSAWAKVFISYLFMLLEDIYQFWATKDLEAKMTPQIAYLEHLLNDRYGTGIEIFISEGYTLGPWIFSIGEVADPEFFMDQDDSFVYSKDDAFIVSFIVNIPEALEDETQNIAAIVQKYKLAGKSFIIQIY